MLCFCLCSPSAPSLCVLRCFSDHHGCKKCLFHIMSCFCMIALLSHDWLIGNEWAGVQLCLLKCGCQLICFVFLYPPRLCSVSVLRWQFCCDGGDVGFGVFMKKKLGEWMKASQMQEVLVSQRYNAHLVPEDGSLTCTEPGVCKCTIREDNKSFFTAYYYVNFYLRLTL